MEILEIFKVYLVFTEKAWFCLPPNQMNADAFVQSNEYVFFHSFSLAVSFERK